MAGVPIVVKVPGGTSGGGAGSLGKANLFPTVCNLSRIEQWNKVKYTGPLARIPTFWIYQVQPQIVLTQELALDMTLGNCEKHLQDLYTFRAGRPGPIDIQHAFKAMCTPDCLESDNLHQSLMQYTGCSCMKLSFQPTDPLYTSDGSLCKRNTGRLLCDKIGFCGIWKCSLNDFMCPRYEFNKKIIPLKGKYGSCSKILLNTATRKNGGFYMSTFRILATVLITILLCWR